MDSIKHILTRDNITLALSIFGAVGTLLSWILSAVQNRQSLKIKIVGHRVSKKKIFYWFTCYSKTNHTFRF